MNVIYRQGPTRFICCLQQFLRSLESSADRHRTYPIGRHCDSSVLESSSMPCPPPHPRSSAQSPPTLNERCRSVNAESRHASQNIWTSHDVRGVYLRVGKVRGKASDVRSRCRCGPDIILHIMVRRCPSHRTCPDFCKNASQCEDRCPTLPHV